MDNNYSTAISAENENLNNTIDNMRHSILDAMLTAEKESEEKYKTKAKLIEEATDMSTPEKLDALDKNYERRNQERFQNNTIDIVITVAAISLCALNHITGSPIPIKNILKSIATLYCFSIP